MKTELSEYNLPFGGEQEKKDNSKDSTSKISHSKGGNSKMYDLSRFSPYLDDI